MYKTIVLDIIKRCSDIGIFVLAITSDMGSSNVKLWKEFGVQVKLQKEKKSGKKVHDTTEANQSKERKLLINNKIPHPSELGKHLYFLADPPHLIKNVKSSLVGGNVINYKTKKVSVKPIITLAEHEDGKKLKIAPKLTVDMVTQTRHFDKMKVSNSTRVISNSVAAGLQWMVDKNQIVTDQERKEALDTRWFISMMNQWFDLMSSRGSSLALSKFKEEKYEEARKFLENVIGTVRDMEISTTTTVSWKPIQTGIILSTQSVLDIAKELVEGDVIRFLLTSRLTQDSLENLFSTVRMNNAVPTALEFRNALKIITVAQFIKTPRHSSYDISDSEYLANYLSNVPSDAGMNVDEQLDTEVVVVSEGDVENFDLSEKSSLYYLCGK